jgi:hypothetical protein
LGKHTSYDTIITIFVTPKVAAKLKPLFNKPATGATKPKQPTQPKPNVIKTKARVLVRGKPF